MAKARLAALKNNQDKSTRGGARPGAGRPKGALNHTTREVREAAREFTPEALDALAKIMRSGKSEAARVAAARELLDRGHGKSTQHVEANVNVFDRLSPAEQLALEQALDALAGERGDDADAELKH